MTCYSYVCQLTKIEFDWVVTAHEHLNLFDDYLNFNKSKPETEATPEEIPFPYESLVFMDDLKNNLIVSSFFICNLKNSIITHVEYCSRNMKITLNKYQLW